jgi:hypothetical protein
MTTKQSTVALAICALLTFAGCSSSDDDPQRTTEPERSSAGAAASGDERVWPGGQKLSHYKDFDSYEWRVAVLDREDELLSAMQDIEPRLDEGDFTDVISTCDAIRTRGVKGAQLIEETVMRFSKSSADPITNAEAGQFVELVTAEVCAG